MQHTPRITHKICTLNELSTRVPLKNSPSHVQVQIRGVCMYVLVMNIYVSVHIAQRTCIQFSTVPKVINYNFECSIRRLSHGQIAASENESHSKNEKSKKNPNHSTHLSHGILENLLYARLDAHIYTTLHEKELQQ